MNWEALGAAFAAIASIGGATVAWITVGSERRRVAREQIAREREIDRRFADGAEQFTTMEMRLGTMERELLDIKKVHDVLHNHDSRLLLLERTAARLDGVPDQLRDIAALLLKEKV